MLRIRHAEPKDSLEICAVVRRSITELCVVDHRGLDENLSPWLANKTPKNVVRWITAPSQLAVVAESEYNIAGFGLTSLDGNILLNYVSPDFRFRGVSKAIMFALEEGISRHGCSVVKLVSTETAFNFYQRLGYVALTSPQIGRGGRLSFPMEKQLNSNV